MKDWENDYDFDDKKSNVIVRKTSGVLGKLIALLLGMVIGAGGVVGGTLGLGYYVATRPVETLVDKTGGLIGDKVNLQEYLDKYINAPYQDQSVIGLVQTVTNAVKKMSNDEAGFSALNEISPAVGEAIEALAKKMVEFGSNLTVEQIKTDLLDTPFKQLGAYISGTLINSIEIGNLLLSTGAFEFDTLTQDSLMMLLFYGIEDEDYVISYKQNAQGEYLDKDGNVTTNPNAYVKEILMQGTSLPLSVGTIRNEGITDLLSNIPLDSLIQVDPDEALMASLAYGSKEYYEVIYKKDATGNYLDKNGNITTDPAQYVKTVQMKQAVYTLVDKGNGAEFYDKNDVMLKKSPIKGGYMVTLADGKTKQYLKQSGDTYLAYKRYDAQTGDYYGKAPYSKTTVGDLQQHAGGLLNKIELASAFGVDETSNPILITLAYGLEGEDFYYDTDGKIQMYAGKSKKSIGDLQNGLDDTITDLPLKTIMNVDPENAIIVSLAYGSANRYEFVYGTDENGNPVKVDVTMNPVEYTFKDDKFYDDKNNEYTPVQTNVIEVGETTQYLKLVTGTTDLYYAYESADAIDPIKYKPSTVKQLQENPAELMDTIELASVLEVDGNSNRILLALAYESYKVENGVLVETTGPRTIKDLNTRGDELIDGITLADALGIDANSHPVMIALAYEDEYEIESNPDGSKYFVKEPKKQRTIQALSGENSNELLDGITLEAALSVNANSQPLMLGLAYGQKHLHYEVEDGKIVMQNKFYQYDSISGIWADASDNELTSVPTPVPGSSGVYELTLNGKTEYLKEGANGNYYSYSDKACTDANTFEKATLGDLGGDNSGLLNNLTLADALGIESFETEPNALKKALAFNKDGSHAYTIGEFSKDPNVIINNIHLDSVIENVQTTDKTTMYLLYGKEDLHFKVSDTPSTDTDPEIFNPDDLTTYYVVMLQKQMTVHQLSMGEAYHVHNEYGELLKDENGFNIVANPIEYNGNACYLYTYEGVTYLLEPDTTLPEIRIKSADHHNVTNTAYYLYRVKTYDETTDEIELEPLDKNLDFYQHNTISNLTGNDSIISHLTERLTLEELVGAHTLAGNKILEPLSHVTIEELPSAVNTLTVSEIFGDQFEYKKAEEDIYDADGTTLLVRQGAYYNMLGESGKAQTIYYNLEDCTFYTTPDFQAETKTEGILTGTWKYLLKDSNGDITNPALVTGMEGMIENITLNMQTTSLNELNDDGIISTSASLRQEPILDTIVDADVNATILSGKDATQAQLYGYKGKTLGDLTITQMTRYLELLLNAYNNLVP